MRITGYHSSACQVILSWKHGDTVGALYEEDWLQLNSWLPSCQDKSHKAFALLCFPNSSSLQHPCEWAVQHSTRCIWRFGYWNSLNILLPVRTFLFINHSTTVNVWHIDTVLFPWHDVTDLLFVFIRVFWCSAIYRSLLTTAFYSVGLNRVTRCFTSFVAQQENASGSALSEVTVN